MNADTMFALNDNYENALKPTFVKNIENNGGYMTDENCYSITGREMYNIRDLMAFIYISAKNPDDIENLKISIRSHTNDLKVGANDTLVTNIRHYEALKNAADSLENVKNGMKNDLSADLLAEDLRQALYHIGSITGEVTNGEVLNNIFGRFCIGK